jgi:FkbM family methyltransferase
MKQLIGSLFRATVSCVTNRIPLLRRRPGPAAGSAPQDREIVFSEYLGDLTVRIDPSNGIEAAMLSGYDPELTRTFARFVKPGDCCIDVGANVGAATLHLAKLVGPGGRVVAVEPGPPYCERMRRNIALNPHLRDRITLVNGGVGAEPGTLTWQADPNATYNAVLVHPKPWPADGTEVTVPVETLDRLVARLGLPRVDFIKIDVESMELEVFRGARETLRTLRPAVVFESMSWAREYRRQVSGIDVFAEIDALLRSAGYATHEILADGTLRPVSLLSAPPENTLALPDPAPASS